jgi:hypothetical protein
MKPSHDWAIVQLYRGDSKSHDSYSDNLPGPARDSLDLGEVNKLLDKAKSRGKLTHEEDLDHVPDSRKIAPQT